MAFSILTINFEYFQSVCFTLTILYKIKYMGINPILLNIKFTLLIIVGTPCTYVYMYIYGYKNSNIVLEL